MIKVMEGVRVLEMAQFTFVPAAGGILADWGADVIKVEHPVRGDTQRLTQVFSNLLGNSVTHGTAATPVRVRATTTDGAFELSVANSGEPIPADAMERLFQPFHRRSAQGTHQDTHQGLGLGLYIASEIARAHDGTIDVTSSPVETRFTFRMPLR